MLLPMVGVTINIMSLFAFILVLGIVVDDAIIVAESACGNREKWLQPEKYCHRHKESCLAGNVRCPDDGGGFLAAFIGNGQFVSHDSRASLRSDFCLLFRLSRAN